ncbi:MAG: prephenate dehydrogenase/arogenate dehydrogenase family protein [Pirellulaceae bacterium]|jgi:prephenate dehydrogenase|nr:prephenate dehydrogenase/arogenate dehydrogenase family protein [Pirellulaceae bacterium]
MTRWDTVAIVGVGLLGGSIGLALQQRRLAREVVGIGRRAASLRRARRCGTVTRTTLDLARGVRAAQLVVVCTPVSDVVDRVCALAPHCPPGALITDVGSTKEWIVRQLAQRLSGGPAFVGSHPLAGSEKTGPEQARADLLQDRVTVVTPGPTSRAEEVEAIEQFWSALGARVLRMTPAAHDRVLAATSHATHVIAAALAAVTPPAALPLVASGWQDTTRVAAGDPALWLPILMTNRREVLKSLRDFEKVLAAYRDALRREDAARLVQLLEAGKQIRDAVGS